MELWFDVGIKRYTTGLCCALNDKQLWFDVGIKRYTTEGQMKQRMLMLWFDVGIKRYTTLLKSNDMFISCGLM